MSNEKQKNETDRKAKLNLNLVDGKPVIDQKPQERDKEKPVQSLNRFEGSAEEVDELLSVIESD